MQIHKKHFSSFGFTLIELLVVIAILGVLAGGVLVAINPLEQLARGRDAGRKTTIDQLGKAVQSYYTGQSATYPATGKDTWMGLLQASGELKTKPQNPGGGGSSYTTGCNNSNLYDDKGYCYNQNGTDAIVYARAESKGSLTTANCTGSKVAWIVWSSAEGKTGLDCEDPNVDPAVGVTGLK